MKRRRPKGCGDTARKLAEMLTAKLGFEVTPDDLWFQSPHWIRYGGCALWGFSTGINDDGCSWDRATDCVRRGFNVEDCRGQTNAFACFEIHVIPQST